MDVSIVFLWVLFTVSEFVDCTKQPNIVFMFADDLGWNDIGFHNVDMLTPNIDELAREGMVLDQLYTQPLCSPSRAALMTGMFPFRLGLQHHVIKNQAPVCAPGNVTFLSEELKELGYSTHAIGKWHLGFCNWNCTPIYRGFDTFFGYLGSDGGHFNHSKDGYLDLRDNTKPAVTYNDMYSAKLFREKAVDVIINHDKNMPLFLYVAFQNTHKPIETTDEYMKTYPNVENVGRRTYSGMVSALDDSVGAVVSALRQNGMYQNTIIVFMADNGGSLVGYGSNYPLRGGKFTIWEGGTRVVGVITGPRVTKGGYRYDGLIHEVDWKSTLVTAAGGHLDDGSDSMDHWDAIKRTMPTKRSEFIYNLDSVNDGKEDGHAGIRYGNYKLLHGYPGLFDGWYEPMSLTNDTDITKIELDNPEENYWLFDIRADPHERVNLAERLPSLVGKLRQKLEDYSQLMVPAHYPDLSDAGDPHLFGDIWSPGWC